MQNKEFDNKLKVKLGDFAPPVPPELWNKIEDQLNTSETPKIKRFEKYRVSFLWYGAIAATLLIAFAFWKFDETEMIYLSKEAQILVSEVPIDKDQHLKESEERISQDESLLKIDYSAKEKNQKVAREKVVSSLQGSKSVKPVAKINSEIGDDYIVQFVEPISSFALSPNNPSLNNEEILSENMPVLLKESIIILEESQNITVNEIEKPRSKRLGVSTILNFLVKGLNNGDETLIKFSESEEGILKLDLKLGLAKSKD